MQHSGVALPPSDYYNASGRAVPMSQLAPESRRLATELAAGQ